MGSGVSSRSRTPSPDSSIRGSSFSQPNGAMLTKHPKQSDPGKHTLVWTNQVAPIIIRNCNEEYQHVTNLKGPLVHGRIEENMPEHVLVQNRYFLVKDVLESMDRLNTLPQYLAPNMRQAWSGFPVYGLGQPTRNGVVNLMQVLHEEQFKDILLLNMREEPVLFVRQQHDMVPYSLHHQDHIHECATVHIPGVTDPADTEARLRQEVLDLAGLRDDGYYFFYHDLVTFKDDPHMFKVAYEDDLAVTEEIYGRLSFNNSAIKYTRLIVPKVGAPLEKDMDAFLDVFKNIPSYFDRQDSSVPAIVFIAHSGLSRTTFGMVLGCLMLAHKQGFPKEASKPPYPINRKSPNFERGEFVAIQHLISILPNGLRVKQEVDVIIDACDELHNVRNIADHSRRCLESITDDYLVEGVSARTYLTRQCAKHVERYAFLILFNAYLGAHYAGHFSLRFTKWMQQRPEFYQAMRHVDISERLASPSLLADGTRVLVADDHLGLDVLSSQMDVKTSNFRRVPSLSVYGMAQPPREGLAGVVTHLLSPKQGHTLVSVVNLRDDVIVECNGSTFSWREERHLEEPLVMPGISADEVEEKEELMKKEIKTRQSFKVYYEVDQAPVSREFNSVLTAVEMCGQLKLQVPELLYHRVPIYNERAPSEESFDALLKVVTSLEGLQNEDGPAIVFYCRTGKDRTTTAMAITCLILCHKKGFPYGTKPGEEERVSLPNADLTKGNFQIVQRLVRRIPNGQQVKREVDFVLDQCSDTMTPMHYHIREVILVTYNKSRKANTDEYREYFRMKALDHLERYIYLILFNTYLHCERRNAWRQTFTAWMKNVATKAGVYDILDSLSFPELDNTNTVYTRRQRWQYSKSKLPYRGTFV